MLPSTSHAPWLIRISVHLGTAGDEGGAGGDGGGDGGDGEAGGDGGGDGGGGAEGGGGDKGLGEAGGSGGCATAHWASTCAKDPVATAGSASGATPSENVAPSASSWSMDAAERWR